MADEQGEQFQHKPNKKSIYDVGYGSIFAKNFVAGFSRALGSIFVYLMFGGLLFYLFMTFILPQMQSLYSNFTSLLNPSTLLPQMQNLSEQDYQNQSGYTISPEQVNEVLEYVQYGPQGAEPTKTP